MDGSWREVAVVCLLVVAGCGAQAGGAEGSGGSGAPGMRADAGPAPTAAAGAHPYVFVIAMENHSSSSIYGSDRAPYINGTLIAGYAHAADFEDELPSLPSEPHYIWMEAGTNAFADHTFTVDAPPSATNSTASDTHLARQLQDASDGRDWMSYQEGLSDATGACPIHASMRYVPRHDPFVFFRDVSGAGGDAPAADDPYCVAHHRSLDALAGDLSSRAVKSYNFISPDLCHDMHGNSGCPGDTIRMGDDWLQAQMPALIAFVNENGGVILITWDEEGQLPFLAVGPTVKKGYTGQVRYDHGSILRSVEEMLGLPVLPAVASTPDLADLFAGGVLPGQ